MNVSSCRAHSFGAVATPSNNFAILFQSHTSIRNQLYLHDRCFAFSNRGGEPTSRITCWIVRKNAHTALLPCFSNMQSCMFQNTTPCPSARVVPNVGGEVGSEPGTSWSSFGRRCSLGRSQFSKAYAQRRRPVEDDVELDDGDFDDEREACTALDGYQLMQAGL